MTNWDGLLLGIDLGTSSAKVMLVDADGDVHRQATQPYEVHSRHVGWAESDPVDWWDAVAACVGEVTATMHRPVASIAVVGQMHGVVLTDASGHAVRPAVLWSDNRSQEMLPRYAKLDETSQRRLGNPLAPGMAGPSLLWLQEYEPEIYGEARWALQPKDWLRMRLTDAAAAEPSDASATLLYDIEVDDWAWSVVEELGIRPDLFAPLLPSAHLAGELTAEAADLLGLAKGVPVAAGAGDTAAAALGSGLIDPGAVQLTVGTGGQVVAPRAIPAVDPSRRTHTYRAAAPDRWYAMAATLNAGSALEWVRGILGVEWDLLYNEAFAVNPGAAGVRFIPYLSGERTPHMEPGARGTWSGLRVTHTRGHLLRGALEGVAFAIRDCVGALHHSGIAIPDEVQLAGGGTTDPRWRQLLADVLQLRLSAVASPNASARGACLLGGVAAGVYPDVWTTLPTASARDGITEPGPDTAAYESAYQDWRAAYLPGPTHNRDP